jgi:sRNA-binding protein
MSRWQLDNVEEELDDEEIARILQEEEYEIARQQQREAQQRQQQQAKQPAATQRPTQAAPLRYGSGPVPPTSTDELLLLRTFSAHSLLGSDSLSDGATFRVAL